MRTDTLHLASLVSIVCFFILTCLINVHGQSYHWSNGWHPGKRAQPIKTHSSPATNENDAYPPRDNSYPISESNSLLYDLLYSANTKSENVPSMAKTWTHPTKDETLKRNGDLTLYNNVPDTRLFDTIFSHFLLQSDFNPNLYQNMLTNWKYFEKQTQPPKLEISDDLSPNDSEFEGLYKLARALVKDWGENAQSCQPSTVTRDLLFLLIQQETDRMKRCEAFEKLEQLTADPESSNSHKPFNPLHQSNQIFPEFLKETEWK